MPEPKLSLAHSAEDYIAFDPFLDCDRDTKPTLCKTIKLVKTRATQMCVSLSSGSHEILPGTWARFEKAYVPEIRKFGMFYVCVKCCDREMSYSIDRTPFDSDEVSH